jgi:hypothetical protein
MDQDSERQNALELAALLAAARLVQQSGEGLNRWEVGLPTVAEVGGWDRAQAEQGLVVLERIERRLAAVRAALTRQMGAGRDTAAALSRITGMSNTRQPMKTVG